MWNRCSSGQVSAVQVGAKKEKKSHYVVTEITKTQPLYLCCRASFRSSFWVSTHTDLLFSVQAAQSLLRTFFCAIIIIFFSRWMRLDSPQLQPVSSSQRDVFIMALTSNPFQISSCLYLHLLHCVLHTHTPPAALPLIITAIVTASCHFVTAAAAPLSCAFWFHICRTCGWLTPSPTPCRALQSRHISIRNYSIRLFILYYSKNILVHCEVRHSFK